MKKHFLADKLPVFVATFLMYASINWMELAVALPMMPLAEPLGDNFSVVYAIVRTAVSFLILFLFKLWFHPEYEGSVKISGLGYGLKLLIPYILIWAIWMPIQGLIGIAEYAIPNRDNILVSILSGIGEEEACRGLGCALILRSYKSEKNLFVGPLVSGVFFGVIHLTNLAVNDNKIDVLGQVLFASMIGVAFGCVFTLSGSILPTMIVHTVYDIACSANITSENSFNGWASMVDLIAALFVMVILLMTLYKKRTETAALWARKWKV